MELICLNPAAGVRITAAQQLADVIPQHQRREVWRELKARGFRLPDLQCSAAVSKVGLLYALGRSAFLAWVFQNPLWLLTVLASLTCRWSE